MSRIYLVIALVVTLLFILTLSKMRLQIIYCRKGKDDEFVIGFSLWRGLISYKLEIPVVKIDLLGGKGRNKPVLRRSFWRTPRPVFKLKAELEGKKGRTIAEDKRRIVLPGPARLMELFMRAVRLAKKYYPVIKYLLRKVQLHRLQWKTEIGTEDPFNTCILLGMVWALKGNLLAAFYRLLNRGGARPLVAVTPSFEKSCLRTSLDCIIEVRIGYIIFTGFKALILRFK